MEFMGQCKKKVRDCILPPTNHNQLVNTVIEELENILQDIIDNSIANNVM